jgi:hypothetical protein
MPHGAREVDQKGNDSYKLDSPGRPAQDRSEVEAGARIEETL